MPQKFFITHSWKDIDFARKLCDDLKANGLDGFFDAYSIKPGDMVPSEIARGLEACDVYVPILSYAALASPWCDEEINAAITLGKMPGRNGRPRIIPILIENCQDKMSVFLHNRLYINFTGRYDEAFRELLTKGFGLTFAPVLPPAPNGVSVNTPSHAPTSPTFPKTNWRIAGGVIGGLLSVGLVFVFGINAILNSSATQTPVPTLGIGSTKISLIDGAMMVYVPTGEFTMGSNDYENEKPPHTVYLDAFWIDKFEVTNALYKKCVTAGRCFLPNPTKSYTRDSYYDNAQYDTYPVVNITWHDANNYCAWAGKKLPTEAQWEKAARGTDQRNFPWGNNWNGAWLNFCDKNCPLTWRLENTNDSSADTSPVGIYINGVSPYGVSDLAGNVWEWVEDWYGWNYFPGAPRNNPTGIVLGSVRVQRGGSWASFQDQTRVTNRGGSNPDNREDNVGFRCAE